VLVIQAAQYGHRAGEGPDEKGERGLVPPVLEKRPDDPGRELAHRQLDQHQNQRDDGCREREDRRCSRAQQLLLGRRRAEEASRDQVVARAAVDLEGDHRKHERGQQTEEGDQPDPGPDPAL